MGRFEADPSGAIGQLVLRDKTIGCLYEGGQTHRRQWIRLARFSLEWLTDGGDKLSK